MTHLYLSIGTPLHLYLSVPQRFEHLYISVSPYTHIYFSVSDKRDHLYLSTLPVFHINFTTTPTAAVPFELDLLTEEEELLALIYNQLGEETVFDRFIGRLRGGISDNCDLEELTLLWGMETLLLLRYEDMREQEANSIQHSVADFDELYNVNCTRDFFYCRNGDYNEIANLLGLNTYTPINRGFDIIDEPDPETLNPTGGIRMTYLEAWTNDPLFVGTGMFRYTFVGPKISFAVNNKILKVVSFTINGIDYVGYVTFSDRTITIPSEIAAVDTDTIIVTYEA